MYRSRLGKKLDDITLSYVSSISDDSDIAFYDILSQKSSVSIAKYLNPSSLEIVKMSSFFVKDFQSSNPYIKIKLLCKSVESDIQNLEKLENIWSLNRSTINFQFRVIKFAL